MRTIIQRLWFEPAVVLGLVATVAAALITGFDTTADVAASLTPLAAALGIRQVVTPVRKQEVPEDVGDSEQNGTI